MKTKKVGDLPSKTGFGIESRGSEIDLVCGMEVAANESLKVEYKGKSYYFCSQHCQKHFENDPKKYAG